VVNCWKLWCQNRKYFFENEMKTMPFKTSKWILHAYKLKGKRNMRHRCMQYSEKLQTFSGFFYGTTAPSRPRPPHYWGFTITLRQITLGRTPLHEWSVRRRDLYLTTNNTHKRETSMPPAKFKTIIPTSEWPQIHALDRAATGIDCLWFFIKLHKF
jgi:hypothetical protein